jgi:hypothetical protein
MRAANYSLMNVFNLDQNLDSKNYNLTPAPFKNLAFSSKGHLGFAG